MNNIKEIFKDKFPKLKNIVFIEIKNKHFPNTLIFVSDMLKIWVHIIDDFNDIINLEVKENIILFREVGFLTGYICKDKFRMKIDGKEFDLDYVIHGNIIKWLADDDPMKKKLELDFDFKEMVL